ncbi:MAG: c-type cytochrome [Verrucomicrobiales bacterium]|nr:c-type cytochrome [Verrucomicrobiales bacterium]
MTEESPSQRLVELVDRLQLDGRLSTADAADLESILAGDEQAREYYVLSQELHTMLGVDNSIRLKLAADLLPDNVIPLPGVDVAQLAEPDFIPAEDVRKVSSKAGFRMATSFVAMLSGVFVLLWMYLKVNEFVPLQLMAGGGGAIVAEKKISYHEQVLPILTEHCLGCHGADESTREANLRLDLAKSAYSGEKPAIVPGNPPDSEMVVRISSTDPELMMPPPEEDNALSPQQVAILSKWIEQGADYEPEWSARRWQIHIARFVR